jgi:MFS family permease
MSNKQALETGGYWQRIHSFTPNARNMLLSDATRSFGYGVVNTLFNLYLVTLGYSMTFVGGLMALGAFTIAFASLAAGPIVARVGVKKAIIFSATSDVVLGTIQIWLPTPELLLAATAVNSITASLFAVAYAPFMAESSTAYERTHLFGTDRSLSIVGSFTGSTLAGFLPFWIGLALVLPLNSPPTFQLALIAWIIALVLGLVPLLRIRPTKSSQRGETSELKSTKGETRPVVVGRVRTVVAFSIVSAITGLGAGFVIPYLTLFFWSFYSLPSFVVGIVVGAGDLSIAAGFLVAPAVSTRIGKVRAIVLTQALSLPFLVLLALIANPVIAILCYIIRAVLMNAIGPLDDTLRMELVPATWRPRMSAAGTFAWNITWAFSTQVTGPLYDRSLYLLPFWFTLTCYSVAVLLYGLFFRGAERRVVGEEPGST